MTSAEIRQSFLDFFESHDHRIVPSASLVPSDDPTLLFTNAGMNQFKDTFLSKGRYDYRRAASVQKCMRVSGKHNDIDNVGPSLRHHTFFEMLGNFSFGDYFKAEAIAFAWQLLTDVWKLPPERLYATIFKGEAKIPKDDEAYSTWRRLLPAERIGEMGLAENFWAMGNTGPCGRCSEIHFYRGDHLPCPESTCLGLDCSCDRYVEIWNNVFMEFERQADGTLTPLPAPSIDTGMGLERVVAVLQNKLSNYDTDLFTPLLSRIGQLAGVSYGPLVGNGSTGAGDVSIRLIADHMRAMTFLIADGVLPSNEWRGYVLRKIMRRAMRHGKKLGMTEPLLHILVEVIVDEMGTAHPELCANRDAIVKVVRTEEERFDAVLSGGLPRLEAALAEAERTSRTIAGDEVFRLYDTFGLPLDFIEDIAGERTFGVDRAGFERALETQRQKSRAGQAFGTGSKQEWMYASKKDRQIFQKMENRSESYDITTVQTIPIVALFDSECRQVKELGEGATGYVLLEHTPFYLEAGGQVSDTGWLRGEHSEANVETMVRLIPGGPRVHAVRVASGRLAPRMSVTAEVDQRRRDATARNHTATHLLHAALRQVAGTHVKQAGSLVAPDRLRFDFVHSEGLTAAQINELELVVNSHIYGNQEVRTYLRATEEAIADGAMALFGEKYGKQVRVVSITGFSMELCGGTHCRATGDIGPFVITQEVGVAAGVRRIEAVTGKYAVEQLQQRRQAVGGILDVLGVAEDKAAAVVQKLQTETKRLAREVEQLKVKAIMGSPGGLTHDIINIDGVKMVTRRVSGLDKGTLRALADSLRDRLGSGVVVLASETDDKVSLVASVTKDLTDRVHAGDLVKAIAPIIGGDGGGRPDFAQAGGRLPNQIDAVFSESQTVVSRMLSSR